MATALKNKGKRLPARRLPLMHSGKILVVCLLTPWLCFAQCPSPIQASERLTAIKNNAGLSDAEKLSQGAALQKTFAKCALPKDSIYARLLHWMGRWAYGCSQPNEAIDYTRQSAQINGSKTAAADPRLAVNSYFNLGYYCQSYRRYQQAFAFYDSCIRNADAFADSATRYQMAKARERKTEICFNTGDYDKAIEEASLGIQTAKAINNRLQLIGLLNARAQARAALLQISEARADAAEAASLIESFKAGAPAGNVYAREQAYNFKIKADISEADGRFSEAIAYHKKAIQIRGLLKDTMAMANGYLNAGQTLRRQILLQRGEDLSSVKSLYSTALALSNKINYTDGIIKALNNLAAVSFRARAFAEALRTYHKSLLQTVTVLKDMNPTTNPSHNQCYTVSDKNFLSTLLANKAECLLNLYKQSGSRPYLDAALKTCLLTDSLIADMRHEQTGEQSKLYWRNETREFFTNAIEACYQAGDAALAFYFMEKSRAVLLNDKLNELGASAQLPPAEAAREGALQNNVFALQQKLVSLADTGPAYNEAQVKLFAAKEDLNRYLQTLQATFPAYYQYKYADAVPRLEELQRYLSANGQSFVHYFTNDTAVYSLAITPSSTTLLRQKSVGIGETLSNFLKTCSNLQQLNNDYASFAGQAYRLYQLLFHPLSLPKGRVIVCSDALTIPFEAFTTDAGGRAFLLADYSFSYVYSATHLLKKFTNPPGKGNFLGVAPVSYASYLQLQPLTESVASLGTSASYYQNTKLLTGSDANAAAFLSQLPRYTVVAVLSHASADGADKEPVLFMADSMIALSQLQRLQAPATQLIVLSACQTNAGRLATGEGVFSLARGFAAAGIPAITATLWKADEGAIYAITKLFLQNIARGMRKDDALQAAKIAYLQKSGSTKNALPYYWANMIVAGNPEPVVLAKKTSPWWWWWAAGAAVISALLAGLLLRRRKKSRIPS